MLSAMKFKLILWGMAQLLKYAAWRYPTFRARLNERNLVAQLKARDEEIGRWYAIRDGRISSGAGLRPDADVTLAFKTASFGAALLMPPRSTATTTKSKSNPWIAFAAGTFACVLLLALAVALTLAHL